MNYLRMPTTVVNAAGERKDFRSLTLSVNDGGKPGYFPASGWQFTRAFLYKNKEWRIFTNVHSGSRAAFIVGPTKCPNAVLADGTQMEMIQYTRAAELLDIEREYNEHNRLRRQDADLYTRGMPEASRREARRARG